jgi:hypothetical protein
MQKCLEARVFFFLHKYWAHKWKRGLNQAIDAPLDSLKRRGIKNRNIKSLGREAKFLVSQADPRPFRYTGDADVTAATTSHAGNTQ